jgi:hypothetical protein
MKDVHVRTSSKLGGTFKGFRQCLVDHDGHHHQHGVVMFCVLRYVKCARGWQPYSSRGYVAEFATVA